MLDEIKQVSEKVEQTLKEFPHTRDSDKELIKYYAKNWIPGTTGFDILIDAMPSFESIVRVRRKLQEQGKYPSSKQVEVARHEEEQKMKAHFVNSETQQVYPLSAITNGQNTLFTDNDLVSSEITYNRYDYE